jgi:phage protein D
MAEYKNPLDEWLKELPSGSELSRRAWIEIKYAPAGETEGKDISEDVSKYLISMSYTDNLSEAADDVTLTLEDRAQLWMEDWFPEGEGNMLDITIHTYNRITLKDGEAIFHAGKFEIDEVEVVGSPSTVQIKGVSVVGASTLRGTRRNQTWEEISVWKCAADICERNNLSLIWDCEDNPNLDHVEQADESDLAFLLKICKDNGMSLKIMAEQIVIFDDAKYEAQEPIITVYKPGVKAELDGKTMPLRWLLSYNMRAKTRDTYGSCRVKYQKGKKKEVIEGAFTIPGKEKGRVLFVREQVENTAEAERLAKKKLREANKEEVTGNFSTIGNTNFAAGTTLLLKNFGKFDGKYIVTKVSHSVTTSYTTSVDIRRCLDGY